MVLVKNTKQLLIPMLEDAMNKAKKDAIVVKFTLIGMVCGVPAVDIC
jgi:hypothetical protein